MKISSTSICWQILGTFLLLGLLGPESKAFNQTPPNHTEKADCANCHVPITPVPGDAGLRPCSRPDGARQAKSAESLRGPRVVILDELERIYLPVPFDHAGHAEMAQMGKGCTTCHHYSPEGSAHPSCKTCHDPAAKNSDIAKPGLKGAYHRQCMSCHREWSGETGCSACHQPKTTVAGAIRTERPSADDLVGRMHPPIAEPQQELYVTEFPEGGQTKVLFRHREHIHQYHLRCAECHQDDNCSRCHQQGKEHVQKVRTVEQHHQPCMACHASDTCESCHFEESSGPPPPFNHASTGWTLKAYHADQSCRVCHPTVPFERRDSNCNTCHQNWNTRSFNHAVTGQILDDTHSQLDCAACHRENSFGKVPTCAECHDEGEGISFPQKRPGPTVPIEGKRH